MAKSGAKSGKARSGLGRGLIVARPQVLQGLQDEVVSQRIVVREFVVQPVLHAPTAILGNVEERSE